MELLEMWLRQTGGRKGVCVLGTDMLGGIRAVGGSLQLVTALPMVSQSSFKRSRLRKELSRVIKIMLKFQSVLWGRLKK